MNKKNTLFEREMAKPKFREKYLAEKQEFKLELQILQALEDLGLTYEEFADRIGTTKGNVSRDLKTRGLAKASIERLQKMADALEMEFLPLFLPRDDKLRKKKISDLLRKAS